MGVSIWWSFIDQYGTDRIRRFIAVDQPAAVAAVPWMTAQQQAESGAIFDVAALLGLGAGLHGPSGTEVRNGFVRSMFSGETDPEVLAFVARGAGHGPALRRACRCCSTTARRTGATCCPASTCPTLVIGCDGSHVAPSSQRYIAEQIPGAEPARLREPTWPARTSRSWRTRRRSTRWSRSSWTDPGLTGAAQVIGDGVVDELAPLGGRQVPPGRRTRHLHEPVGREVVDVQLARPGRPGRSG